MQHYALVIHDLMETPDRWTQKGSEITNGYYRISMDGTQHGAGAAMYSASESEVPSIRKAIESWKKATRWKDPAIIEREPLPPIKQPAVKKVAPEDFSARSAVLDEFRADIVMAHSSYKLHMDPVVFSNAVDKAISKYESKFSVSHGQKSDRNSQKTGV